MDTVRIAELLRPFLREALDEIALKHISIYIDLLLRWNARVNLTAVRDEDEMVTRHFGESLFLAQNTLDTRDSRLEVIDVGSGAGFPGLPLKIWAPVIQLRLIESNHKKAAFLREVARALTLTDINVNTGRAESLPADPAFHPASLVTLRAVEHFETILPVAAKLVAPSGRLALLVGSKQLPDLARLAPGFQWQNPVQVPNSEARVLAISEGRGT